LYKFTVLFHWGAENNQIRALFRPCKSGPDQIYHNRYSERTTIMSGVDFEAMEYWDLGLSNVPEKLTCFCALVGVITNKILMPSIIFVPAGIFGLLVINKGGKIK
jgi:hypothetical protein